MPIKVLENNLINKIAAGEVVERPSSIVKELVENSLDAGSTEISIEIFEGGKAFIKITDNGCGIKPDEVMTAFLRHATSKISNLEDLENILTLGFRGEALSSISSVSKLTIITRTSHNDLGYKMILEGGRVVDEYEISANVGTTFIIENLFFNVPARLKFLKRTSTESSYITDIITKMALGNPNVSFKYINNSNCLIETSGNGKLDECLYKIYGREIGKSLLMCNGTNDFFSINGYICKGEVYRSNRNYSNLFINGRYIKNKVIEDAVLDGYREYLPIGKFPIYALNISINPSLVDVNVHPTKLEVRFSNENKIYDGVYRAIKDTLGSANLIPKPTIVKEKNSTSIEDINNSNIKIEAELNEKFKEGETYYEIDFVENNNFIESISSKNDLLEIIDVSTKDISFNNNFNSIDNIEVKTKSNKKLVDKIYNKNEILEDDIKKDDINDLFTNYNTIGQIFNTYWIIEAKGKVYMIDQHSAHERILYEEYLEKYRNSRVSSQLILEPIILVLSEEDSTIINENSDIFTKLGFEIEVFGKDTFAIRALPFVFQKDVAHRDFFMEIIEEIKNHKDIEDITHFYLEKIISMSCKAAIKGNDKLSHEDARALISSIVKLKNPFTCPHGRPTIIEIDKYEIEKLFRRVVI